MKVYIVLMQYCVNLVLIYPSFFIYKGWRVVVDFINWFFSFLLHVIYQISFITIKSCYISDFIQFFLNFYNRVLISLWISERKIAICSGGLNESFVIYLSLCVAFLKMSNSMYVLFAIISKSNKCEKLLNWCSNLKLKVGWIEFNWFTKHSEM